MYPVEMPSLMVKCANICSTAKQLFSIIQSISSPNAEPFKQWLAQVGSERLDEIADHEIAIEMAVVTTVKKEMGKNGPLKD